MTVLTGFEDFLHFQAVKEQMTQQIWLVFAHRSGSAPGIDCERANIVKITEPPILLYPLLPLSAHFCLAERMNCVNSVVKENWRIMESSVVNSGRESAIDVMRVAHTSSPESRFLTEQDL